MMRITAAAAEQMKEVLKQNGEGLYIRIYVDGVG
jgi:Fe-S cluster assembly iron-binding protein IscA